MVTLAEEGDGAGEGEWVMVVWCGRTVGCGGQGKRLKCE